MKKIVIKSLCLTLACLLLCGAAACGQIGGNDSSVVDLMNTETTVGIDNEPSANSTGESVSHTTSKQEKSEETVLDIASMTLEECFPHYGRYLYLQEDAYDVVEGYLCGYTEWIRSIDKDIEIPERLLHNSMEDYRDYCITHFSNELFSYNGAQMEKASLTVSVSCIKKGQEGTLAFDLDFIKDAYNDRAYGWQMVCFDLREDSEPNKSKTENDPVPSDNSVTVREFLSSSPCRDLQTAAFNFVNAYFSANYKELRQMYVDPSKVREDAVSLWGSFSIDDYTGYSITSISLSSEELNGETVPKAYVWISMPCRVKGYEGENNPCLQFVYINNEWKLFELIFG